MNFELTVGKRHLLSRRSRMLSVVTLITVLGIAFGVMALMVTLAVIKGFHQEYERSVLSFNAHLIVMRSDTLEDVEKVRTAVTQVAKPGELAGISPFLYREGLAIRGNRVRGLAIKVVALEDYWRLSGLQHAPRVSRDGRKAGDGLWVGQVLEQELKLQAGPLRLRLPERQEEGEAPAFRELPIAGTFSSGMYDYDSSFALMDLSVARDQLGLADQVSGLEIWLTDPNAAASFASRLSKRLAFPYTVLTWQELNANLFGALQLERLVFALIMGILILVASFNIAGTLTMRIIERRGDIAILRAMGATWRQIRRLFFGQGLLLGWVGCAVGLGLGILGLELLGRFKPLKLAAEIYFIDFVPARWSPIHIVIVLGVTTVFSWLATRVALMRLKRLSILQALNEI